MKDFLDDRHSSDLLPAGFDPHSALMVLNDYLNRLEDSFDELKKGSFSARRQHEAELRALQKQRDDLTQEIERLTNDLMELTHTLEDQESIIQTSNQKVASFDKQYKKLSRDLTDLQNKYTQRENDATFHQNESIRLTQDNETMAANIISLNNRLDELERKLAAEHSALLALEKDNRRTTMALSESQGKCALLEAKYSELTESHRDDMRKLQERMSMDSQHEAQLLRKRVKTTIGPEMREMERIFAEKPSAEVASDLKALLIRLITKLEQSGLDMKPREL